jgi:hypothetical protein
MPLREPHLAAPGVELLLRSGLDALPPMMPAAAAPARRGAAAAGEQAGDEGATALREVVFVTPDTTLSEALQARRHGCDALLLPVARDATDSRVFSRRTHARARLPRRRSPSTACCPRRC